MGDLLRKTCGNLDDGRTPQCLEVEGLMGTWAYSSERLPTEQEFVITQLDDGIAIITFPCKGSGNCTGEPLNRVAYVGASAWEVELDACIGRLVHVVRIALPVEVDGNTRLRQTKILKEKSDA